jgi:hypothetical protein
MNKTLAGGKHDVLSLVRKALLGQLLQTTWAITATTPDRASPVGRSRCQQAATLLACKLESGMALLN